MKRHLCVALLSTAALLAPAAVRAQATPPTDNATGMGQTAGTAEPANPADDTRTAGGATQQDANTSAADVVVTGSRVIRNGDNSPTPVTVVGAQELLNTRPGNIADALYQLPAFTQTRNQTTNPGAGGGSANNAAANNAINTVNLRGLGSSRTLVLYNGRRLPVVSPDGWADINLVPQLLLQRVDTVTGGASAVYGSDAIGGVVNFVTDTKFVGLKGEVRGGRSTYGDGNTLSGGIAYGTDLFGGRGHFEASYYGNYDHGIGSRQSRPWGRRVPVRQGNGTTIPYYILLDGRTNNQTFGGKINTVTPAAGSASSLTALQQFVALGGVPVAFNPGLRGTANGVTTASYQIGGDGGYQDSSLRSRLELHQFSGRFDYDISDAVHGYVDANGLFASSGQFIGYNTLAATTGISGQNAFLAPAYRFNGTFTLGKFLTQLPQETNSDIEEMFVTGGLEGDLGGGYKWSGSVSHGIGRQHTSFINFFNNQKLAAALDAVPDAAGNPVCYAKTQAATAAAYADCVPLNPFGVLSESAAAIDYVTDPIEDRITNTSTQAAADITGSPFSTWAGPVNVALSAEWRRLTYEVTSTSQPASLGGRANCTNIRTFGGTQCGTNTAIYQQTVANRSPVSQTVWEGAVEADVPLLTDQSYAKSISVNLAARYASYTNHAVNNGVTSEPKFDAFTYKAGLVWDVNDTISFRVTRSHDFRAPNLDELYRPVTVGLQTTPVGEQLGAQYTLQVVPGGARTENGGNERLQPETANATTAGVVFRPAPGLSFAVDGFRFEINDASTNLLGGQANVVIPCVANPSLPICYFLERNAAGQVTVIRQGFINAAKLETYGFDFEANWRTTVFSQPFTARFLLTHQPHFRYNVLGTRTDEAGAAASFGQQAQGAKTRISAFVTYKPVDALEIAVFERWRSKLLLSNVTTDLTDKVASVAYTNLNLTYTPRFVADGNVQVFLNVQNLFNKQPPPSHPGSPVPPGMFGGAAPDDDVVGRYYTAGVRFKF